MKFTLYFQSAVSLTNGQNHPKAASKGLKTSFKIAAEPIGRHKLLDKKNFCVSLTFRIYSILAAMHAFRQKYSLDTHKILWCNRIVVQDIMQNLKMSINFTRRRMY